MSDFAAGLNLPLERPTSIVRRVTESPRVRLGAIIVILYALFAVAAPLLHGASPFEQDLSRRLLPPVWEDGGAWTHPLGADHLGRDVLARLLHGARISLAIGLGAAAIGALIGVSLGLVAGYFGGWADHAVSFLLTTQLALPSLLFAMALVFLIGPSTIVVILVIGLLHWSYFLVVTRATTMRIRELDYVRASKVAGASTLDILTRDVLPNLFPMVLVIFTLEVGVAIMAEAALSFLGVGVPAPTPTWGLMIAEGRAAIFLRPWLVILPGLAIFGLVSAVNFLGDGLRDALQSTGRT
jgi:peptide/nickel transport system permease protein